MLTDVALKSLKSIEKPYKITDRDGMYVHVSPGGTLSAAPSFVVPSGGDCKH